MKWLSRVYNHSNDVLMIHNSFIMIHHSSSITIHHSLSTDPRHRHHASAGVTSAPGTGAGVHPVYRVSRGVLRGRSVGVGGGEGRGGGGEKRGGRIVGVGKGWRMM